MKKFNYSDVKSASTPVDLEKPLVKDGDADDVDVHLYRSMIGSLMYLTASRPDIMFAVCACARFQVTPKTSHLLAVKRIFRYLKGKPTLGLWYSRDSPFELVAYTDSDYAGATQDRKSTTGGCQFLGNRLISWQCKKQTVVATSTTEAEYVAAASCCGQVLWIQNQLLDYGYNFMNTVINIDNNSTICIIENPVQHSKTKHIEIRHHFIRDCNTKKLIQMVKIHTDLNVADLLTKGIKTRLGISKEVGTPRYLSIVVPLTKVGDEAVHKELGDRMERAAATASSLEAEQDSGSGPRCQDTILGDVNAQTRFEITSKQSIDPPLSRGYTLGSGVDSIKLIGIDGILLHGFLEVTTAQIVNGVRQLQALVDKKRVIVTESSIRRYLHLDDAEEVPQDEAEHEESVPTPSNDPQPSGEDSMQLTELMVLCTKLQIQVLDLQKAKDAQAKEIAALKKRIQGLERRKISRPTGLERLRKVDIDADVKVTLVDETQVRQNDDLIFNTGVLDDVEMPVEAKVDGKDE
ncbi:hypothetical protein Tco_0012905 [Tanacetum coccineum]